MKILGVLFCSLLLLAGSPSFAAVQASNDAQKVLIRMLLLGCLPNAMGVLPLTPENSNVWKEAGLVEGKNVPPELVKSLAMTPDNNVVVSKSLPNNFVIVASPGVHACRIAVLDTPAEDLRAALRAELENKDAPWKLESTDDNGKILAQAYKWYRGDKPTVLVNISGPPHVINNGSGLQLMVDVALVKD